MHCYFAVPYKGSCLSLLSAFAQVGRPLYPGVQITPCSPTMDSNNVVSAAVSSHLAWPGAPTYSPDIGGHASADAAPGSMARIILLLDVERIELFHCPRRCLHLRPIAYCQSYCFTPVPLTR